LNNSLPIEAKPYIIALNEGWVTVAEKEKLLDNPGNNRVLHMAISSGYQF
jgi:hypothetical protein